MTGFSLALSTALAEPKKFTVDGEEFIILGVDHLSPEQEAEAMALFARLGILMEEQAGTKNVQKGKAIAAEVIKTRHDILTKLTTLRREVAERMPLSQKVLLLEAIEAEMDADENEGSTGGEGTE